MALRDNSIPSYDNRRSLLGTVAGEPNAKCRLADSALGGGEWSQTDRSDSLTRLAGPGRDARHAFRHVWAALRNGRRGQWIKSRCGPGGIDSTGTTCS